jgi:fatty-acyl-CoA synthase
LNGQERLNRNLICRAVPGDLLVRNAARSPYKTAMRFRETKVTYRQFNNRVNRLAHALVELGIEKGDMAGILSHNCDQMLIFWYALMKIGAIMVPINWMYKEKEIKYVIDHSEARMLVVEDSLSDLVKSISGDLKTVRHFGIINLSGCKTPPGWFEIEDLQGEKYSSQEPEFEIANDDPAVMIYTSGTESAPKGALIRHMSFVTSLATMQADFHFEKDMVFLGGLPCFHLAGLWNFANTIGVGGTYVIMDRADPEQILRLTDQEQVTHWSWVTTLYVTMLQMPRLHKYNLKSVKVAAIFGSYVSPTLLNKWKQHAPDIMFVKGYAQTECCSITAISGSDFDKRPDSVGLPQCLVQLRIEGPDGKEQPPNEEGEIVVRCPAVMIGYFKDQAKTEYTLRGGWHHTGDIGKLDEDGYLYFIDRIKDMIKTGGENVASSEVEEILLQHPKISEASVIGIRHPIWLEAVTAVVTPLPDTVCTETEIIDFCKERMAGFKVPKKVIIRGELPKSHVGKILKKELKIIYGKIYSQGD